MSATCVHCKYTPPRVWLGLIWAGARRWPVGRGTDEYGRGTVWLYPPLAPRALVIAARTARYPEAVNPGTPCERCGRPFNGVEEDQW